MTGNTEYVWLANVLLRWKFGKQRLLICSSGAFDSLGWRQGMSKEGRLFSAWGRGLPVTRLIPAPHGKTNGAFPKSGSLQSLRGWGEGSWLPWKTLSQNILVYFLMEIRGMNKTFTYRVLVLLMMLRVKNKMKSTGSQQKTWALT